MGVEGLAASVVASAAAAARLASSLTPNHRNAWAPPSGRLEMGGWYGPAEAPRCQYLGRQRIRVWVAVLPANSPCCLSAPASCC